MADVTHDWDEEDYVKSMTDGYEEYRKACYGVSPLPPAQVRETKQAFLSGIHWLNTRESYDPTDIERGLRKILGQHNPFINSSVDANPLDEFLRDELGEDAHLFTSDGKNRSSS